MIINIDIKEIGTYSAFHRGYYKKGDSFIFPYINVHVDSDFPLNKSGTTVHLNFVYFVFSGVEVLKENNVIFQDYDLINDTSLLVLAGLNLETFTDSEYVFQYKKGYLDVPEDYKISKNGDEYFLPIDDKLLGKANLDLSRVEKFFNTVPIIDGR